MEEANLSVGYVARRSGVKVSTLHFYEQKGLIRSWRNQGNQRRYKRDVLRRISVIKAAQKLGISLSSIHQTFLDMPNGRTPDKKDWAQLSMRWQQQLDQQITALTKLRDSLDGCIGCGCLSMQSCPIYNPDDVLEGEGPGPVILDRN
ncbi:redox-sensitive transcriptional activator SoxR [Paraglaciecola sp. MB-3u-78]|jgi:MerR family redox-sensitive transcriptional activator SoxR|uniref:redox-sensitive transcriptional activator SoxR n=1 Tax=Paraglaciecola sp. MB-3u-78 TaxID=2058332 RepID=UPI000C3482C6|nr:redox-sensitive transcriptional activator SoxR [Paraglaciecola sp. MB-3u-78]PKG98510.1 redox-sensitive transcriptional activator SoxR [Paraglaciecola sp. MB-3u-78]